MTLPFLLFRIDKRYVQDYSQSKYKLKQTSGVALKFLSVLIASWFYTGFIPPILFRGMAGTYGSFFSLPLCWALLHFDKEGSLGWYMLAVLVIFFLGLATIRTAEKAIGGRPDWKGETKTHDQNQIVIDETLGMLFTCMPLSVMPVTHLYWTLFLAFLLFRLFDIAKAWPAKFLDRIDDPATVMLDDVVAGCYAGAVLWFIVVLFHL